MPCWYRANLGGHTPGHLRDALCDALARAEVGIVAHWSEGLALRKYCHTLTRTFNEAGNGGW